ncbi:hypothetical protein NFI96_027949 [Prochilodus magdalenae]|nr:hypothetical protein NFI96_027949 [Prochilodus magdalenae]
MLPTLWGQFGDGPFLFQHGRTPVHRASSIKTWMSELGVGELNWPAQSPELNPIDHLWGWIREETESQAFLSNIRVRPHQCGSGRMVRNSHEQIPNSCGKPSQKSWSCSSCKGWADIILTLRIKNGTSLKFMLLKGNESTSIPNPVSRQAWTLLPRGICKRGPVSAL